MTTDKLASYPKAIRRVCGRKVTHRTNKYLNNRIEQDHRGIKRRYGSTLGFKSFDCAAVFCSAVDETRQLFRKRTIMKETISLDTYGNLVSQRRGGASTFYHYDGLPSTTALTNASQNITDTYKYDAYGSMLASTGSTNNPYGYVGSVGYYNEPSIGLQYLRDRWYDPSAGMFVSLDRLGQQYLYAQNSPVLYTDPSGFWCVAGTPITIKEKVGLELESLPGMMFFRKTNKSPRPFDISASLEFEFLLKSMICLTKCDKIQVPGSSSSTEASVKGSLDVSLTLPLTKWIPALKVVSAIAIIDASVELQIYASLTGSRTSSWGMTCGDMVNKTKIAADGTVGITGTGKIDVHQSGWMSLLGAQWGIEGGIEIGGSRSAKVSLDQIGNQTNIDAKDEIEFWIKAFLDIYWKFGWRDYKNQGRINDHGASGGWNDRWEGYIAHPNLESFSSDPIWLRKLLNLKATDEIL